MLRRGNIRGLIIIALCLLIGLAADLTSAQKRKRRGGNSRGNGAAMAAIRQGIAVDFEAFCFSSKSLEYGKSLESANSHSICCFYLR